MHDAQIIVKHLNSITIADAMADMLYRHLKKQEHVRVQVLFGTGEFDLEKPDITYWYVGSDLRVSLRFTEQDLTKIANPEIYAQRAQEAYEAQKELINKIGAICGR